MHAASAHLTSPSYTVQVPNLGSGASCSVPDGHRQSCAQAGLILTMPSLTLSPAESRLCQVGG